MGLQRVNGIYKLLRGVIRGDRGLQGVTWGYKGCQGVTRCDRGFQGVKRGDRSYTKYFFSVYFA